MSVLVFGVDPGLTGAIAVVLAGQYVHTNDMPTVGRGKLGRQNVCPTQLAEYITSFTGRVGLEHMLAVVEQVNGMNPRGKDGKERRAGGNGMFRFGKACGVVEGVFGALQIPVHFVVPHVWKRALGLIGKDKEASRALAIELFPDAPLSRKRDHGRAEALLIAKWGIEHGNFA